MARKPNYNFEKRRKEQERRAKKEAKRTDRRQRREDRLSEESPAPAASNDETPESADQPTE